MPPRPRPRARPAVLALAGLLAVGALAPAACARPGRAGRGAAAQQARTTLQVRNQNFLDMNIYVVRNGVRSRLGTVTGNTTRTLVIPPAFVQPLTRLRFQADPVGRARAPISDDITVSPGDEVALVIPPG